MNLILLFFVVLPVLSADLPTFTIDLDLHPLDRWTSIIPNFSDPMEDFNRAIRSQIPAAFIDFAELIANRIEDHIPSPYREELDSIARAISMPLADILLINLVYELRTFCTSILMRTENRTILHGRNLDFDLEPTLLRRLTFRAKFLRSSKSNFHYESIHFAGSIGLLTSARPGQFSLSINQRQIDDKHWWMNALMSLLHLHAMPLFILTRSIFDNPFMSYREMSYTLQHQHIIAPVYFILTDGLSSASIITRNRLNSIYPIDLQNLTHLVQTNFDHWLDDPVFDLRRTTAEKILQSFNATELNAENLFQIVLSVIPVLNHHTIYTALMNPNDSQGDIRATIRRLKIQ